MYKQQKIKTRAEVEDLVNEMHLTNEISFRDAPRNARSAGPKVETNGALTSSENACTNPSTSSPIKSEKSSQSPQIMNDESHEIASGEMAIKLEPAYPTKLARMTSHKGPSRPVTLFDSYANKTEESKSAFQVIEACIYSSKQIGSTEQAMECDCAEEWSKITMTCAHAV